LDLIVVRHAMAWERDPERWPDDRRRPLRPFGIRRFRAASRGLARLVSHADALWTSPFTRAVETAAILHDELRWPAPRAVAALGEGAPPAPVLRAIARARGVAVLVIVGHAPSLDQLVTLAVTGRQTPAIVSLRKGGVACLHFETAARAGAGVLEWVATPRLLRALDD
jgi:phosphohistidine phosphatase SixA